MNKTLPTEDLAHILEHTAELWKNLKNKTFFITGGTGFFGKWILESFIYINSKLKLNANAIVLSRNPEFFFNNNPQFVQPNIQFIQGDIQNFEYPNQTIDYIIHAATDANDALILDHPLLTFDSIVNGTKYILELAKQKKVKAILHTSSGAVYGKQPSEITHVTESYSGSPNIYLPGAAYGEGKRVAEMICNFYYLKHDVPSKIARCYAFVGPYLPLEGHFAVGNFIKNIKQNKDIIINGDGTPMRSYLYAADLVIWLWTVLFRGESCRPYNIGSDKEISIENVAILLKKLSKFSGDILINQPKSNQSVLRYVPNIDRIKMELGLDVYIDIDLALYKTLQYHFDDRN